MARPHLGHLDRLRRLVVFEAAARGGGFTAAAREFGITQPAVTRHIVALERSLGTALFQRTANRARLTDAGRHLAERIGAGLDVIESGLSDLETTASLFVLASPPGVAQQWLMPRVDRLHAALGDLELRLQVVDRDTDLSDGTFDAAVRIGDGRFVGQSAHRLFDERVVPIASAAFAAEHSIDADTTADQLLELPFVHLDDGDRPWLTWAGWLQRFDLILERRPGRTMWNNYPLVVQQVLAGRGIGLGWRPLVDELLASEVVVAVGPEVRSDRSYYVTWPTGEATDEVRAVIDVLTN